MNKRWEGLTAAASLLVFISLPPLVAQAATVPKYFAEPAPSYTPKVQMNVLFLYDSSRSMWGQMQGKPKMDSARQVVDDVITGLPPSAKMGLMAFGHRRKGDCDDIELLAPIGQQDAKGIQSLVRSLQPTGTTPLSKALTQAADVLKDTGGAKMIVLITDGGEECGSDPCEVARKLAQSGLVVRVDVVGFDITHQAREQLQCVAKEGMGRFFEVKDRSSLFKVIDEVKKDTANLPAATAAAPVDSKLPVRRETVLPSHDWSKDR